MYVIFLYNPKDKNSTVTFHHKIHHLTINLGYLLDYFSVAYSTKSFRVLVNIMSFLFVHSKVSAYRILYRNFREMVTDVTSGINY